MRLQRLVLELRPGVRARVRHTRLDDPRPEALEIRDPRLRRVRALGLAAVADLGRLAQHSDGEPEIRGSGTGRSVNSDHRSATSSTVRAIGPTVSSMGTSGNTPSVGISPHCDLSPTTSHAAAGSRIEAPVSVPSASSQRPAASAAAEPADEPPVVFPGCVGLRHVP